VEDAATTIRFGKKTGAISMNGVRLLLFCLLALGYIAGCGASNDPVIPENPTAGPPDGGPSREGLPGSGQMKTK
jgi:hypothetical protein